MWKKILLVLEVVTEDEVSAKWKRFGSAEGDSADYRSLSGSLIPNTELLWLWLQKEWWTGIILQIRTLLFLVYSAVNSNCSFGNVTLSCKQKSITSHKRDKWTDHEKYKALTTGSCLTTSNSLRLYLILWLVRDDVSLWKNHRNRLDLCPILQFNLIHFSWYSSSSANSDRMDW